jgi:hypothetical protein
MGRIVLFSGQCVRLKQRPGRVVEKEPDRLSRFETQGDSFKIRAHCDHASAFRGILLDLPLSKRATD